ncbi:MAG: nucleotidyltransferase family protein [Labilithrix sp.]|nr:nucleotidyltransferase family protein [Labilithrix sp.]MCW5814738.1 nucleotidyltransferase family protein [Labilithrix sp.]
MSSAALRHPWQVSIEGTLRDVFLTLERGGMRVAVATGERGDIVGIMTDGDARRALLGGASLETPLTGLLNRSFTAVEPSLSRTAVLDLMHARHLDAIPIVDEKGLLVGLHQLHDVLRADDRENWAVIMVGGRGTRLGAITTHLPKPMVRVAGRPILERLVLHLVGFGVRRIFLAINYLGHVIEAHFGDGARFGCTIEYLREERPLGTGGALSLLPSRPRVPLLVLNGDLVTQADLGSMLDFHESGGQAATLAVRPYFHTIPFGCVDLEDSRVVRIEEKPRHGRIINAGMYVLSPAVLERVPPGEASMPGLLEACLAHGDLVRAFEIEEDWIDVGQREQLYEARGEDA